MSRGTQGSGGSAGHSPALTWDPAQGPEEAKAVAPSLPRRGRGSSPSRPSRRLFPTASPVVLRTPYPPAASQSRLGFGACKMVSQHPRLSQPARRPVALVFTRRPRRRGGPRSPGFSRAPRSAKARPVQLTPPSPARPSWPVQPGFVRCGNGGEAGRGSEAEGSRGESR